MLVELAGTGVDLIDNIDLVAVRRLAQVDIDLIAVGAQGLLGVAVMAGHGDGPRFAVWIDAGALRALRVLDRQIQPVPVEVRLLVIAGLLLPVARLCEVVAVAGRGGVRGVVDRLAQGRLRGQDLGRVVERVRLAGLRVDEVLALDLGEAVGNAVADQVARGRALLVGTRGINLRLQVGGFIDNHLRRGRCGVFLAEDVGKGLIDLRLDVVGGWRLNVRLYTG